MTKKEIVRQIADRLHETQLKTKEIVQLTFDAIIDTLIADRRIELRNFGVFEVKLRKPRKARNPRSAEPVDVPAKFVVTFKPGKEMEERVVKLVPTSADLERLKNRAKRPAQPGGGTEAEGTPTPAPVPAPSPAPSTVANDGYDNADAADAAKKRRQKKTPQATGV